MAIGSRTFLELQVGRTHSVEVLLHLRLADAKWFHSSPDLKKELFRLLSQHVIFREFEKEIQEYHDIRNGIRPAVIEVGEKNKPKAKKGKKRKAAPSAVEPVKEKPKRAVRHVFGTGIQITYKMEEISDKQGATLIFPRRNAKEDKGQKRPPPMFRQRPKLSKRIVLWCYPRDETNDDSPIKGQGFPRPEMVPITSLFREPAATDDRGK
jgi:hypothetical protein